MREKPIMDVRCTSTGKVFYQIDSQIGGVLCEALPSIFERVERPAPAPLGKRLPVFTVNINPLTDKARIMLTKITGEIIEFPGPNGGTLEQALAAFERAGFPVPQNIVGRYTELEAAKKKDDWARYRRAEQAGIAGDI